MSALDAAALIINRKLTNTNFTLSLIIYHCYSFCVTNEQELMAFMSSMNKEVRSTLKASIHYSSKAPLCLQCIILCYPIIEALQECLHKALFL